MTSSTAAPRQRMSREDRKVVAGTMVGTTIEWYDFFIFAQAAGEGLGMLGRCVGAHTRILFYIGTICSTIELQLPVWSVNGSGGQ